ncbi:hypothetical protein GCK72_004395 [Caenorhabditis remanei]|uniref:F-box domain-containing protein n=1 Tax=Caenorhabditis remanei TaxID=31234 RepID=A0A6A5HBB6_CAERE|nr:hypothetical protein GCK72_004395 [Caenorhabditis remanei]KAF1764447.1 hypothetical protein GCK72_004395 [Caenorhabditis remanei]
MPTVPLQYETLKSVLLYMEPNIRFRISLCMPAISTIEKRIPLKIENLKFTNENTKINRFSYRLGLYLDYGRNEIPVDVHDSNSSGGSSDDFDQYGFIIYPGVNDVLPGDIDLRKGHRHVSRNDSKLKEENLVQRLRIYKKILAERLNQQHIEDDETRRIAVSPWDESLEDSIRRSIWIYSVEDIKLAIETTREDLTPFNNRRDNRTPPYTACIQLSVKSTKGYKFQRVLYNKYLYEAEKAIHTKLFGNRDKIISVKNLKIDLDNRVLRFPEGINLKIENLEVSGWSASHFECLKSIIDPSSFPIQQLKMKSSLRSSDFQHNIAREAKSLTINNDTNEIGSWTPILLNLTNRKVCLMNENERFPPNNYVDLIENWLEKGRPVGTTFSMGLENEDTAKQCLNTLRQRLKVLVSSEKQVQLRINASLTLTVFYVEQDSFPCDSESNYWLRLKVVRNRSE